MPADGGHASSNSRTQLLLSERSLDANAEWRIVSNGAAEVEMRGAGDVVVSIEDFANDGIAASETGKPAVIAAAGGEVVKLGDGFLLGGNSQLLSSLPSPRQVSVSFADVDAWVPTRFEPKGALSKFKDGIGTGVKGMMQMLGKNVEQKGSASTADGVNASDAPKEEKKQILYGVAGSVAPGEVLAFMGPSGSGKTSLVTVVGGRKPKLMDVKGEIFYNGKELNKLTKRKIGFVLQDDLLYETLTVEETLHYAALLRLPKSMSRSEKKDRANRVISTLGLNKCRNTLIGGVAWRGVSGGERKRVSVGHELLIDPSVLILDEPTSGLDSTTAMHLLTLLRSLAEGGRSIITTIHQPSSRLYQQLDKVMLLSEGCVMYYGRANLVIDWFANLGFHCPYGMNVADYVLDLSNGDMALGESFTEDSRQTLVARFSEFKRSHPNGVDSKSELPGKRDEDDIDLNRGLLTSAQNQSSISSASLTDKNAINDSESSKFERWGTSFGEQVKILFQRCVLTRRLDSLSWQKNASLLGIALVTGLLWWQEGDKNTLFSASELTGLVFFEMAFVSMYSMFTSLFTFPSEYSMLLKERASGMYRLSAFYIARSLSDLPMDCFIPTIYVVIVYWFGGLRPSAGAFFAHWASVILVTLLFVSYGLLIGATVMNPKTAQTISTVVMLTFLLTGGYYVRNMPNWIDWMKYVSPHWWTFKLLLKIEYNGVDYQDCGGLGEETEVTDCEPVEDIANALNLPGDVNDSVWPDVLWLLLNFVAFRVIVYLVLRHKAR